MVRRGGSFLDDPDDPDATVRTPVANPSARFERDEEPEERRPSRRRNEPEYDDDDDYEDEDDDRYDSKRRNKRFVIVTVAIIAALIAVFAVLWFTLFRNLFAPASDPYTVPKLIGQTIDEAQATLDADETLKAHFTITATDYASSEEYAVGVIISQTPTESSTTRQDVTEIKVTLSSGPAPADATEITLDDYTNQDYRLVKNKLEDLGFTTRCESEYSDDVEEGMVIRTDPVSGKSVEKGSQITIYYSQGPEKKTATMVSVLNLTESDARNAISQLGLVTGDVTTEYNDQYAEGRVCYQSVPANTTVDVNSKVNLIISLGKEPAQEPDTPTTPDNPSNGGDDNTNQSADYLFTIPLPSDRTDSVTVVLNVNGSKVEEQSIPASYDESSIQVEYEGTVNSYSVTINGTDVTSSVTMTKQ